MNIIPSQQPLSVNPPIVVPHLSETHSIKKGRSLDKLVGQYIRLIDNQFKDQNVIKKNIEEAVNLKKQYYSSIRGFLPNILHVFLKALFNIPTPIDRAHHFLQSLPLLLSSKDFKMKAHEEFNFEDIQKFKAIKKEAKELLKQVTDPTLKSELKEIIKQYDALVESSEVLKDLRELSRAVRGKTTLDEQKIALHKFAHFLFADTPGVPQNRKGGLGINGDVISEELKTLVEEEVVNMQDKQTLFASDDWKTKWAQVRERVWKGAQEVTNFPKDTTITWMTGNTSAALIGIKRIADNRFIQKTQDNSPQLESAPALVPTGALRHRTFLVPISGELEGGITKGSGINFGSLSGVGIAQLQVASYYAHNESFKFDPEKELQLVRNYDPMARPDTTSKEYYLANPERLRIAVIRLLLTDSVDKSWLREHLIALKDKAKDLSGNYAQKSDIQEIIDLIEQVPHLNLDTEEESFLSGTFPIIWASTTLQGRAVADSVLNERQINSKADLGTDLQIAFTSADKVQTLQNYLDGMNVKVKVFSLDAAHYLRMRQAEFSPDGAYSA